MNEAKTVQEIKERLRGTIDTMVAGVYSDEGERAGGACADFAEHLLPHIDESIDSAHALGMKK